MNINFGFLTAMLGVVVLLYVLIWVFIRPFKKLLKILLNSVIGVALLWLFNIIFAAFGFTIGINFASATICGVLGVAGFALLLATKLILGV